jgi:hypothetical protein
VSIAVLSTTGRPVDLTGMSTNDLAGMLDALDDERRRLAEQQALIGRELTKRFDGKTSST